MARKILGGIAAYIVLFILIFATFTCAYLALGPDKAFQPGSYDVTMLWIAVSLVLGLICSVIAGYVAAVIGSKGAVKVLAGIVLVMGILTILAVSFSPKPGPRTSGVSNMEAMTQAQQPLWLCVLNPIVGIIGVMVGGGMRKERVNG